MLHMQLQRSISPFQNAAFLTMDGVGEWATTSYGIGLGIKWKS